MDTQDQSQEMMVPPPETIAFFVRFERQSMKWKQATLAAVAGVSLSTVQRVERAEPVASESLEKIGQALGQRPGAFTEPRTQLSEEEAAEKLAERFSWLTETVSVSVAPMRKEPQLRELLGTVTAIFHSDLGSEADEDLELLKEWLDLTGFMTASASGMIMPKPERDFRRRDLYGEIFSLIADMERRHKAVCLVGSYDATSNVRHFENLRVGVLAFRSKITNPAAEKIRELRAPPSVDLVEVLRNWAEEE